MTDKTPEERKQERMRNLEKARLASRKKQEEIRALKKAGQYTPPVKEAKRPRNLDRIVRDILDNDELVDKVISNQPEYWSRLPTKNGAYIISTVMMVKAMGGDIKAAEWIRKTGFGDKVQLETDNGFFAKSQFTIQVLPSGGDIDSKEITQGEIKQIGDDEDVEETNS